MIQAKTPEPADLPARHEAFSACRYALLLLVPAFIMLYMKYEMMQGGYWEAGRSLGRDQLNRQPPDFSWSEKLSFYRGDLLVGFVLLPLGAWSVALVLPRSLSSWTLGTLSVGLVLVLALEYRTWRSMGRFPSKEIVADAIRFWQHSGDTARQYATLSLGACLKLAALVGGIVLLAWRAHRSDRRRLVPKRGFKIALGCLAGGVLAVTGWSWLSWLDSSIFHRSILDRITSTFWGRDDRTTGSNLAALPAADLVRLYREMTGAPEPKIQPDHWGQAQDCDVIFFVLETAPAKCLDLTGELRGCPTLRRLRERSWVGLQHHSTYPFTSRAVFSLLTAWYPSSFSDNFPSRKPERHFPGIMASLKDKGYMTAAYVPDAFTRLTDDPMYALVGIDKRFYRDLVVSNTHTAPVRDKIEHDRIALNALLKDMSAWHKTNQRFAAVFQPQIGHGPWPDVTESGIPASDLLARGRALIAFQDVWLAEIVEQLERAGRLDKTLIVVTGDHGIRTQLEDPAFQVGMIQEDSFHVPILLYAPTVLSSRRDIPWLTSHIDVAPSLLDLLGVSKGRQFEQGSPLWDERLAKRATFFWGNHFLGSDGYYEPDSKFAMWSRFRDTVYISHRLEFDQSDISTPGSSAYNAVTQRLTEMIDLQEAWGALP